MAEFSEKNREDKAWRFELQPVPVVASLDT